MIESPPSLMTLARTRDARAVRALRTPPTVVPRLDSLLSRPAYLAKVRRAYASGGESAALSTLRALAWDHGRCRARSVAEHREVLDWQARVIEADSATIRDAVALGWLTRDPADVAAQAAERARQDAVYLAERHAALDEADARRRAA